MSLIETRAVQAVLLLALAASVFAGAGFAGFAIFMALAPVMAPAWAAAIAAAILIGVPLLVAFVVRARVRAPRTQPQPQAAVGGQNPETAAVAMIAGLAKEKPLLAVLFAGLLGAAGTLANDRRRAE